MKCSFCHETLVDLHGSLTCVNTTCPMKGVPQLPCCEGETAENAPPETPKIACVYVTGIPVKEEKKRGDRRKAA